MPPKVEEPTLASLRKPMNVDGVITYFLTRRLSLAITRRIIATRITPNQVTLVTLLLGISSGLVVAIGGYWAGVIGALLLQTQAVLDCVDGELARLRSQKSRLGEWLDTVSDDVAILSFLGGVTWIASSPFLKWFGMLGIASLVISQTILYSILALVYHSGDIFSFPWGFEKSKGIIKTVQSLRFLFWHDSTCLIAWLCALLNRLDVALLFISIGKITRLIGLLRLLVVRGTRY